MSVQVECRGTRGATLVPLFLLVPLDPLILGGNIAALCGLGLTARARDGDAAALVGEGALFLDVTARWVLAGSWCVVRVLGGAGL